MENRLKTKVSRTNVRLILFVRKINFSFYEQGSFGTSLHEPFDLRGGQIDLGFVVLGVAIRPGDDLVSRSD